MFNVIYCADCWCDASQCVAGGRIDAFVLCYTVVLFLTIVNSPASVSQIKLYRLDLYDVFSHQAV